jgi:capsid assembly protease
MKRELLIAEVARTTWAIEPKYGERALGVLARWARGEAASEADLEAARNTRDTRTARLSSAKGAKAIAVLPMYGAIAPRANLIMDYSGGTSCQVFSAMLQDALSDDSVGQILIDIDSPGGSVSGVPELASEIMQARTQKPVIGIADHLCASAAYWLGSCCTELYASPSAEVGSIGVYTAHQDLSQAYENEGVKTTLISAGKFKTEGHPFGPLDADAKAFMQSTVDSFYRSFTAAVARGRGIPVEKVRSGMGQGRCLVAQDALAQGMVDGITDLTSLIGDMQARPRSAGSRPRATAALIGGGVAGSEELARLVAAQRRERELRLLSL